MKNLKKYKLLVLISLIVILVGIIVYRNNLNSSSKTAESSNILFYSTTCPHCKNVEQYITDNGVKNKLSFQELEVSTNKANANLIGEKARECNLDISQGISVPFFYDGEKCIIGDQNIINYFQTKING